MEQTRKVDWLTKLRRSWNYPLPNGESLSEVYSRVVPYFLNKILPKVNEDKNILVVAHGNSLRTLIKYIENISDEGIAEIEIAFGQILIYHLNNEGHIMGKEIRQTESNVPA
jgi:2,3-bisphosphoglycerate-dependent phosphoglycerate mutase